MARSKPSRNARAVVTGAGGGIDRARRWMLSLYARGPGLPGRRLNNENA